MDLIDFVLVKAPKQFKKFGKLPGKPSKLIALALADLKASEKAKRKISMACWCRSQYTYGINKLNCAVCFAGSVMVGTLRNNNKVKTLLNGNRYSLHPSEFPKEGKALEALNEFRQGEVKEAFHNLKLVWPEHFSSNVAVTPYEIDKVQWRKDMKSLIKALEKQGY